MNRGAFIFLGAFLTFAAAWMGLVFIPYTQLARLPARQAEGGDVYPQPLAGVAVRGREVYRSLGCLYCHSQQVRPEGFGSDQARGWGDRRTVADDYLHEAPVLLGTMRTGPDLANIGVRQPSDTWHHLHLYDPQITSKGSLMPPFKFLYETVKFEGQRPADALNLPPEYDVKPGTAVVPTDDAKALVEYLKQQQRVAPIEAAKK